MLPEWLQMHETSLWWMGAISVLTFLGTLIVIPFIVVRIPTDYFVREPPAAASVRDRLVGPRLCLTVLKNLLGLILILAGIVMIVLPGQGVLTILLGVMFMDFPGKRALELRIVTQPTVLRGLNWMRARADRPELLVTQPDATVPSQPDRD